MSNQPRSQSERKRNALVRMADRTLTGAGLRNIEHSLHPARVTGLPQGGVVVVAGVQTGALLTRAWDMQYREEVRRTVNGYAVLLHPTRSRGDVVEMTWPQFITITQLLGGIEP